MQCNFIHYNTILCITIHFYTLQYNFIHCNTFLINFIHCNIFYTCINISIQFYTFSYIILYFCLWDNFDDFQTLCLFRRQTWGDLSSGQKKRRWKMRNSNSWKRRRLWSIVHLNQKVHRMVLESSNWLECTLGYFRTLASIEYFSLTVFCAILGKEEERFLHWRYQRCRRFLQKLAQLQVDLLILDHALPPYARYSTVHFLFPPRDQIALSCHGRK